MIAVECVLQVWNTLMNAVEWNKKEELVADQSLKYLKQYTSLIAAVSGSGRAQLTLITKIQDHCYENMNFLKVFAKIIQLLYRSEFNTCIKYIIKYIIEFKINLLVASKLDV